MSCWPPPVCPGSLSIYRPPMPQPQPSWTPRPPLGVIQPQPESSYAYTSTSGSTAPVSYDSQTSVNSYTEHSSSLSTVWTPRAYQTLEPPTTLPKGYTSVTLNTTTAHCTKETASTSLPPYNYHSSFSWSSSLLVEPSYGYATRCLHTVNRLHRPRHRRLQPSPREI